MNEPAAGNQMAWSQATDEWITRILGHYPESQAALLPVLHAVQREHGWLSLETMDRVADRLGIGRRHVYGVATFYTMFNTDQVGTYHIQVCRNLSCSLVGGVQVLEYLKAKLGLQVGRTTSDGRFTLSTVECLGSCGTGPVMQINDSYHENLTPEKIDRILEKLQK